MLLVPALAFLESCLGIGLFVSGALLLIVASVLFSTGVASLELIVPLAMSGALAGDHVGFYAGYLIGPRFHHSDFAAKYGQQIQRADALIARFGGFAIFVGRFVPAIRSIVPAVVGISGFSRRKFFVLDVLACISWSLARAVLVKLIDVAV
ncbi:MAG: DedA family protein [Pseudomonadales bacterium]|nr:DedA family protein [Pseudomonadales bacterium]